MLRKLFLRKRMLVKLKELREMSGSRMTLNAYYYFGLIPLRSIKTEHCGFGAFEKIVEQDDRVFWQYLRQIQSILLIVFRMVFVGMFLNLQVYFMGGQRSELRGTHLLLAWIVLHNVILTGFLRRLSERSNGQMAPFLNALTQLIINVETAGKLSRKEDRILKPISGALFMGIAESQIFSLIDCKFNLLSFINPQDACEVEQKGPAFWTVTMLLNTWTVVGVLSSLSTWAVLFFRVLTIGTGVLDDLVERMKGEPNPVSINEMLHRYRSIEIGIRCFDGSLYGARISCIVVVYATLHAVYFNAVAVFAVHELDYFLAVGSISIAGANLGAIFWGLKVAAGLHERSQEFIDRLRTEGQTQGSPYLKKMGKSFKPLKLAFRNFYFLDKTFVLLVGAATFEVAANFLLILLHQR